MRLSNFWVVTEPTKDSTIADIAFVTTPRRIALQIRGGLDVDKIVAYYTKEDEAITHARMLIHARQALDRAIKASAEAVRASALNSIARASEHGLITDHIYTRFAGEPTDGFCRNSGGSMGAECGAWKYQHGSGAAELVYSRSSGNLIARGSEAPKTHCSLCGQHKEHSGDCAMLRG